MKDGLTPIQAMVLKALTRAANADCECPTNSDLADSLGTTNGSEIIAALEAKGLIAVERSNSRRVVTILSSGKRTAGTITDVPWRQRSRNRKKTKLTKPPRDTVTADDLDGLTFVDRDPCFYCGARKDACRCGHGGHL
jgi:DNA-binding MarR family transcriptional regulator